jgi:O-antigen ligase
LRFSVWLAFAGSAVAGPLSHVELGPVSGQGALTVVLAVLVLFQLAASASRFRGMDKSLRSLAVFACWYFLSFFWGPRSVVAFQNALVMLTFVGLVFLCSWYGCGSADLARRVARLLPFSTGVAAILYAFSLLRDGPGAESIWGNRTFALFALPGLAWCLAGWRYGRRACLWGALGITLLTALSLSRLAFAVAVILFPVSQLLGVSRRKYGRAARAILFSAAFVILGLATFKPLAERFATGGDFRDVVESEGSAEAYTSGRTEFWAVTFESALDSIWVGKGVGSSGELMQETFPSSVGHPHNEYLRILHDCGLIGLSVFVLTLVLLPRESRRRWNASSALLPARLALATFLCQISVLVIVSMENPIVYIFFMAPLGVLVGTTLALPQSARHEQAPPAGSRPL